MSSANGFRVLIQANATALAWTSAGLSLASAVWFTRHAGHVRLTVQMSRAPRRNDRTDHRIGSI
jgi:hypothetical protein